MPNLSLFSIPFAKVLAILERIFGPTAVVIISALAITSMILSSVEIIPSMFFIIASYLCSPTTSITYSFLRLISSITALLTSAK